MSLGEAGHLDVGIIVVVYLNSPRETSYFGPGAFISELPGKSQCESVSGVERGAH